MGFKIYRHITRKFCRKLLCSSHRRIHRRTVAPVTDRHMPPSYQVRHFVIFKLGHTRRNQRRIITIEMDCRRGIVASLMRRTQPDPVGVYYQISPFKLPKPLFHPHSFIIPPISLSFQLPQSLPLSTDHCPSHNYQNFLKVIIY